MSDSSQLAQISRLVDEIIDACLGDPRRVEVAIVNFRSLLVVMQKYEQAPKLYNDVLTVAQRYRDALALRSTLGVAGFPKPPKSPVIIEFEQITGRKAKQKDLKVYGNMISARLNIPLTREVKRNKTSLIQWYTANWASIKPVLIEIMSVS